MPKASVGRAPAVSAPAVAHKLLVEHHNRLAVLERTADRLTAADEQMQAAAPRYECRLSNLQQMMEQAGARGTIGPARNGGSIVIKSALRFS